VALGFIFLYKQLIISIIRLLIFYSEVQIKNLHFNVNHLKIKAKNAVNLCGTRLTAFFILLDFIKNQADRQLFALRIKVKFDIIVKNNQQ